MLQRACLRRRRWVLATDGGSASVRRHSCRGHVMAANPLRIGDESALVQGRAGARHAHIVVDGAWRSRSRYSRKPVTSCQRPHSLRRSPSTHLMHACRFVRITTAYALIATPELTCMS